MGTPANSRRRILSREMSEDENMMMVIKEADAKLNARQASFAEAKEASVKKLMRQQQKVTREDFEEKYMDAVQSIGHLETEKTLLVYEVDRLRDILEGTEEELIELHRNHTQISRELEIVKVAKHVLQQKINCMEEQLEEQNKSEDTEIAARENLAKEIPSNLRHQGDSAAKIIEFKSDNGGKRTVEKLSDVEQKHLRNGSFETKSNRPHKTAGDIANGKDHEGRGNVFTQQGADDARVEGSTGLIKESENVTVIEKVNSINRSEIERDQSNTVMVDSRSEALEQLELGSEKDTKYKETRDHEEKEQKARILEGSKVASEDTVHKWEMNEGDEAGTREEVSNEECLNNTVERGVRKQVEGEEKIMVEMSGGKNLEMVKEKSVGVCGSMTEVLQQVDLMQDHRTTPGESSWEGTKEKTRETVGSELGYTKMDNQAEEMESGGEDLTGGRAQDKWLENGEEDQERNETNVDLDMGEQKTGMDGQAPVEGKETQNESGSEQNNGGKEKGASEMLEQLTKKIVTRLKNFTESEGTVNREDHVDGHRGETDGETEEQQKEQNEEYVCGGIEEKNNDELSRKGLVGGVQERPVPEGSKAATKLIEEAEGAVDDLSDEEMHDAAESIVPEPKSGTHAPERNPNTEDEPEGTATNDDTELGEILSASESIKRHLKHRDTCQVS